MKRQLLCIILLLLTAIPMNVSATAIREKRDLGDALETKSKRSVNDVFYDDFSEYGEGVLPAGFSAGGLAYGKVETRTVVNADGVKKSALAYVDQVDGGASNYAGVSTTRSFPLQKGSVAIETSFKYETISNTNTSFAIVARQGSTRVIRIIVWSSGGVLCYHDGSGGGDLATSKMLVPGEWYNLRIVADFNSRTVDVRCQSNVIKNGTLPPASEVNREDGIVMQRGYKMFENFQGEGIDNIHISTEVYSGIYYLDYLKVEKDAPVMPEIGSSVRPEPLLAPKVPDPVLSPVSGRVNINYNGEIMYYSDRPKLLDGTVVMNVKDLSETLGLRCERSATVYTLSRDGSPPLIIALSDVRTEDKKDYVPIRLVASHFGLKIAWEDEKKTVYLTEGGGI
jgi:hypothetical protein